MEVAVGELLLGFCRSALCCRSLWSRLENPRCINQTFKCSQAGTAGLLELLTLHKFCLLLDWLSSLYSQGQVVFVAFLWGKAPLLSEISNCVATLLFLPLASPIREFSAPHNQHSCSLYLERGKSTLFFLSCRAGGVTLKARVCGRCWANPRWHLSASWLMPRWVFSPGKGWGCALMRWSEWWVWREKWPCRCCSTEERVQLSITWDIFILSPLKYRHYLWHQLLVVHLRMDFWPDRLFWEFPETQMGCFVFFF